MQKNKNFKGRLLKVTTQKVCLPNGHKTFIDIVKHPGAVLVIPLFPDDKVIILRQYRPAIKKYIYELPAGTIEKNESPVYCARREIIEETGYRCSKLIKLGEIIPVPGYSTEKIFIYKAEGLKKTKQLHQKDEVIEKIILTRKQINYMFKTGRFIDAKTICAFSMCGWIDASVK